MSKKFEGLTDLIEPWYRTAYSVNMISNTIFQNWLEVAPNEHLHLPMPNVFIPTSLELKNMEKAKFPVLLRKTSASCLWYKADSTFMTPKACIRIYFNCPYSARSPESEILTYIFTRLLMDYLNEYAYDAQVAGLYYALNTNSSGFQVAVAGYYHKITALLQKIIAKISQFKVEDDRFYIVKEAVTKEYKNFRIQDPYQQALYYCSLILEDQTWSWAEQLDVLPNIKAEELAQFTPRMLSRAFLECYVAGNILPDEAISLIQHAENILFEGPQAICRSLFPSQHLVNRIVKLKRGIKYFYHVQGLHQSNKNSALVHYIQGHQDNFKQNVKLELLVLIAKHSAFHQLRSVEQLGYITALMSRNDAGVYGLQFIIQSSLKDPSYLNLRVETFLKLFEQMLDEMTIDEFMSNVNALIDMKLEKHKNLREEAAFFCGEIFIGSLKFERQEKEVSALRELSKQDLIDYYNEYVRVNAPQRRSLIIQVFGCSHLDQFNALNLETAFESQCVHIDDISNFRRSQSLFGSFKGGWFANQVEYKR